MRQRLIPVLLLVIVSSIYYATSAGLTSSNDGSHYALLRSMVDEGRFRIETYAHFAEGNDLAIRNDVIYSDRPPGTALMAVPFYWLGGILPGPFHDLPSRHDEGNPRLAYLLMFPALAGGAVIVIVYLILRSLGLSELVALTGSTALAFGTILWKYGGVLYSHAPSALLVIGSIALALKVIRDGRLRPLLALLLGFSLGMSVLVEYSNVLFVGIVLLYLAAMLRWRLVQRRGSWGALSLLGVGAAIPAAFFLYYNTVNFGGPFTTSYRYAINYPWAASFATTFDFPLWQGLKAMLWYGIDARDQPNQGLFLLMPITIVGLAGVWTYTRSRWKEAILVVGVFLLYLMLFSKHHTFSGFTFDGRYLTPFISLWFIPVSYAMARIFGMRTSAGKDVLLLLLYGLLFLSVRNMLAHIAFSYNYHLDLGLLARSASTPANWSYITGSIFVNWQNIPLLWGVEGSLGALIIGALAVWRRINPAPVPAPGSSG